MMKNEVLSALRCYNLDPFLGVLHADRHGRPSLALDLQEEFRPLFCDAFVTRLINRGRSRTISSETTTDSPTTASKRTWTSSTATWAKS